MRKKISNDIIILKEGVKNNMSLRKKYLIHISIFLLVFLSLLTIGTFFDLEISKILASGSLKEGAYYSTNKFGRFFEYFGSYPIFALGIFACLIFMHNLYNSNRKIKYLSLIYIALMVVIAYWGMKDTVKYYCQNHDIIEIYKNPLTKMIVWGISIVLISILVFFYRKVDLEKNKKLIKFAYIIIFSCLFYLVIELIKTPMGRMRFRAMNSINDFSYFTNWYIVSDAKELVASKGLEVVKDGFKSFPSGHTFSAGIIYTLICLPYVNEKYNNRKWKVLWYVIPIVFTGLVGLSRIMVGAHYLTDVLVGGTIAYIAAEVFKYIFIIRKN